MIRPGWAIGLLGSVGSLCTVACDEAPPSQCRTEADCAEGQHCLVDPDADRGTCLRTPGRSLPTTARVQSVAAPTDVLLVVDDGPRSAPLQARLVASLDALVERAHATGNDTRVAVTSTSVTDGLCPPDAEPLRGSYRATSCLDRLDDFVAPDGTDARWLCTDTCTLDTAALGLTPERPWLELAALPPGVEPTEALACLVPQGIAGCETAAPLAALRLAITRSNNDGQPETGFLRKQWPAHAVVVTDRVDCSLTEEGIAAFDPAGARALWSDPTADSATPAVCWNAGVACTGDPAGFDECSPTSVDVDGNSVLESGSSVLEPLSWYEWPEGDVILHVIAGVPTDGSEPSYSAAGDPADLDRHGIDPGCADGELSALPPVRLRDVAATLGSICAPDHRAQLDDLAVEDPLCIRACDAQRLTVTLEPPGADPVAVPTCEPSPTGPVVPEGAPGCMELRPASPACTDEAHSVELVLRGADRQRTAAFLLEPDPWAGTCD